MPLIKNKSTVIDLKNVILRIYPCNLSDLKFEVKKRLKFARKLGKLEIIVENGDDFFLVTAYLLKQSIEASSIAVGVNVNLVGDAAKEQFEIYGKNYLCWKDLKKSIIKKLVDHFKNLEKRSV